MEGPIPNKSQQSIRSLQNLPIQTCGNVCGVTVAILGGIASAAPNLWRGVFLSDIAEMPDELKWLLSPSIYSDFLRCSLVSWLVNGKVDLKAIGIHDTPISPTNHPSEAETRNETQPASPSKRRKMRSKLRRKQRKHQTLISHEKRDADHCLGTSNHHPPKLHRIDESDYIYVDDDHVSDKCIDDSPESPRCSGGDFEGSECDGVDVQGSQGVGIGSVAFKGDGDDVQGSQGVGVGSVAFKCDGDDVQGSQGVCGGPVAFKCDGDDVQGSQGVGVGSVAFKGDGDDVQGSQGVCGGPVAFKCDGDDVQGSQGAGGGSVAFKCDGGLVASNHDGDDGMRTKMESDGGMPEEVDDNGMRSANNRNGRVKNRELEDIVDSDDVRCENTINEETEADREDKRDAHVEEGEPEDSDDRRCESASDEELEGNREDNSNGRVKKRELIDFVDSYNGRCESESDEEMEVDGDDKRDVHVKERQPEHSGDGRHENVSDGEVEGNGEDYEKNVVEKDSGVFFVGQKFHAVEELETAKRMYEDSHFCELWKRDVRTLTAAAKRVPKRVANANPDLTYYSLQLSCKFGGRNVATRVKRKRKTKSFRQGCPFEVHITLSEDGKYLQVNRISGEHNHVLQKQIYEHLPRQRAARNKEVTQDIKDAIKLQANPKLLKQKIETATGKKVTLKDISNIKQNSKKNVQKNDLEDVIGYLKKQPGCWTDAAVDEENNFKGLFYQDAHMQNMYAHFLEILLVDATYKLLDLRMPVYLLMCIDGDGLSEVVAMFIVAEETKEVIQATVELFKKHNPSWDETKVVMSDKDFTERDVFKACFPSASLSICPYHTLRSFRREITCEKMGITSAERLRVLEILSSLAHSKTAGEYE